MADWTCQGCNRPAIECGCDPEAQMSSRIAQLESQLTTAERERDEALKDSARLDWLQSRSHTWHFSPEFAWPHYLPNGQTSRLLPIRAAIDATRGEGGAGEGT